MVLGSPSADAEPEPDVTPSTVAGSSQINTTAVGEEIRMLYGLVVTDIASSRGQMFGLTNYVLLLQVAIMWLHDTIPSKAKLSSYHTGSLNMLLAVASAATAVLAILFIIKQQVFIGRSRKRLVNCRKHFSKVFADAFGGDRDARYTRWWYDGWIPFSLIAVVTGACVSVLAIIMCA